jgi:hypothetical protein|nr:MAG TPA: hypothetical protein [Caudoviricetes sp.]
MLQSFFLMRRVPILVPPFIKTAPQTVLGDEKAEKASVQSPSSKKAIRLSAKKKVKTNADAG